MSDSGFWEATEKDFEDLKKMFEIFKNENSSNKIQLMREYSEKNREDYRNLEEEFAFFNIIDEEMAKRQIMKLFAGLKIKDVDPDGNLIYDTNTDDKMSFFADKSETDIEKKLRKQSKAILHSIFQNYFSQQRKRIRLKSLSLAERKDAGTRFEK